MIVHFTLATLPSTTFGVSLEVDPMAANRNFLVSGMF